MVVNQKQSSKDVQTEHLIRFASKLKASLVKPKHKLDKSDIELRYMNDRKFIKDAGNQVIYQTSLY